MAVNPITVVNTTVTLPPAPSTLQQSGAFVSVGGSTKAPQSLTLLTSLAALTAIIAPARNLSALTWSGSTVTATTASAHGYNIGDTVLMVIAGCTPAGYNTSAGIPVTATITSSTQFTYPLASNPGAATILGNFQLWAATELKQMGTTFFAQGSQTSVWLLELGESTTTAAVGNLNTWISANPSTIYSYLVPREFDANAAYLTTINNYTAVSAKTYFFTTTTTANYANYAGIKSAPWLVEAAGIGATEFSMAAVFYVTLTYAPSSTNQVTPLAFSYLYGVTAWNPANNAATLTAILAAYGNYVGTGSEGGLTNTILRNGLMPDGNSFNFWYAVDWAQINLDLAISNAVINGSNNPQAPLYYNQNGINTLQNVAANTLTNGVSYGLLLGPVVKTALPAAQFAVAIEQGTYIGQAVINAEPFLVYTAENPSNYAIGKYGGFAASVATQNGFLYIIFNLNVTEFV